MKHFANLISRYPNYDEYNTTDSRSNNDNHDEHNTTDSSSNNDNHDEHNTTDSSLNNDNHDEHNTADLVSNNDNHDEYNTIDDEHNTADLVSNNHNHNEHEHIQSKEQMMKDIKAGITKKKPSRTKDIFSRFRNSEDYNNVSMDGGTWLIPKEVLIQTLPYIRKEGYFFSSLVPQIVHKTILFIDLDHLTNDERVENFMRILLEYLSTIYPQEFINNYYITKSQSLHRFHIYFPFLKLTYNKLKIIWGEVNSLCDADGFKGEFVNGVRHPPIDEGVTGGLRYDGFQKYKKGKYLPHSAYLPYANEMRIGVDAFKLDEKFYHDTYLLVDDDDALTDMLPKSTINLSQISSTSTDNSNRISPTVSTSQLSHHNHSLSSNSIRSSLHNSSLQSNLNDSLSGENGIIPNNSDIQNAVNNNQEIENEAKQNETRLKEYRGDEVQQQFEQRFAYIVDQFEGHTVEKITIKNPTKPDFAAIFHLSKSKKDRTCPMSGRVHRNNNTYFTYTKGTLQHRCYNNQCRKRFNTVWRDDSQVLDLFDDDDEMSDDDLGDCWTDVDLAAMYIEFNTRLMFSTDYKSKKGEEGTFFIFDPIRGIWVADRGGHKTKKDISTNFRTYVKKIMNEKIRGAINENKKKALQNQKNLLNRKMGDFRNLMGIVSALVGRNIIM